MQLSILIVSYEVRERLQRCLFALGDIAEIVVVDNASSDGSAAMVASEFPHVRLISWSENRGFSAGVNAAAKQARGDHFLLLNPDTIVDRDSLSRMVPALRARPEVGALGFRQVDERGRFQLTIGPPPSLFLELVRRVVQRRLDVNGVWLAAWLDRLLGRVTRVPWVAGSALLVRRKAFFDVHGFDEGFFLYFEDIDFCLRLRQLGHEVCYDPSITVMHVRGESAQAAPSLARKAYRESQLRYWQKYRGSLARGLVHAYQRWFRPA